jgi:hypothetical protein
MTAQRGRTEETGNSIWPKISHNKEKMPTVAKKERIISTKVVMGNTSALSYEGRKRRVRH